MHGRLKLNTEFNAIHYYHKIYVHLYYARSICVHAVNAQYFGVCGCECTVNKILQNMHLIYITLATCTCVLI